VKKSAEAIRADSKKVLSVLEQDAKESIDVIAKNAVSLLRRSGGLSNIGSRRN
jgi:hypothetical protein